MPSSNLAAAVQLRRGDTGVPNGSEKEHARGEAKQFPAAELELWRHAVSDELQASAECGSQRAAKSGRNTLQGKAPLAQGHIEGDCVEGGQPDLHACCGGCCASFGGSASGRDLGRGHFACRGGGNSRL